MWFDCLEIIQWILSQDGCFINTVQRILLHHSYRLHTTTVPAAYEPVTFSTTLTTPYCRPVTAALELVTQSLIILPRSRVSVLRSYVRCALTAASSSVLPMTYSGRPPRPRPHRRPSSAVQPRYVSSTLTNMSDTLIPNNNINLPIVGTHYSVRTVIFHYPKHSTVSLAAVSLCRKEHLIVVAN